MMRYIGLFALVALVGCGGSTSTPTPTTRSITVTLPDTLAAGTNTQATAVATLSNNTTQPVTTGFKSDALGVATVTDAGLVTGVSNGNATIFVVSNGAQGSKLLRVLPNYQGNWSGRYNIVNCQQTGIFVRLNACAQTGGSSPITAVFTQSGQSVTGRVALGSLLSDTINAPISGDGSITFATRVTASGDPLFIDGNFSFQSSTVGQLSGTVVSTWRFTNEVGQMVLSGVIPAGGVTKSSVTLTTGAHPTGFEATMRAFLGR